MKNWIDKYKDDRATQYCLDVQDERIIAGPYVRAACDRHIHNIESYETDSNYLYKFDKVEASEGVDFFESCLCLNGGQFEGKPFILFPWEAFIIGSIFGWKRKADNTRRFRVVFIETAKGSGKSPLCAGVGIKGLVADGEERAEIYAAATLKDQAMVLFRDACAFYDQSPMLQARLQASGVGEKRWNLAYLEKNSFFRVIATDTKKGKSGPRPHMALLDEIHEHADGSIIEMLRAGFKFRRQPLSFMITNSGHNMQSVCREYHDMGIKIAQEQIVNDEFFAYICSLDDKDFLGEDGEQDDHYLVDENLWPKANPSLEYGIPGYDYIRSQIREARGLPSKMSTIKRLLFCVWTEAENPAISKDVWMACQDKDFDAEILLNRKCWGGLDLSSVNDLTAFALVFEPSVEDPYWRMKVWFWMPGIGLQRKEEIDHVPYLAWRDAKYINAVNRKTIEYEFVVQDIVDICAKFDVQQIAFDRWNKKDFDKDMNRLGVSLPELVEFGQGYKSMSPAIKVFETKLIEGTIKHDGNPCLTWNAANVVATEDASKNKKYDKGRSTGRIDGIIAIVSACGILQEQVNSVYDGLSLEEMRKKLRGEI